MFSYINKHSDEILLMIIIIGTLLYTILCVNLSIHPFEDAAMLMRYALNFAKTGQIVWNIGELPVDGATDFLFTIILGLTLRTGISVEIATRGLIFVSHILTIATLYHSLRKTLRIPSLIAIIPTVYFAIGPGLSLIAAYFGTPFFVLFVALSWSRAIKIIINKDFATKDANLFVFLAIIMSLIRPEGVILSVLMLLTIVAFLGLKQSIYVMVRFVTVFMLIGGAYFIWRWIYFGYPLPNPYYKKGGGFIHMSGLLNSIDNLVRLTCPFLILFLLGFKSKAQKKLTLSILIPIIGFTLIFALISDEMNFGARFQYPLLPIVLLGVLTSLRTTITAFNYEIHHFSIKLVTIAILAFVGVFSFYYQHNLSRKMTYFQDGRYDVAKKLNKYAPKGYTLATSEAGILPLYSDWRTVDTWGLNDQWIAHNGEITDQYLDKKKPEIVVFHAFFSPQTYGESFATSLVKTGNWHSMVDILERWCQHNKYILAATFGNNPNNTHYYYVRSDFIDSQSIIEEIRTTRYIWFENGKTAQIY